MQKLKFKISTGLKDIIGKDLITNEQIAIFELVKNSFDAYSPTVEIIFENILKKNARIIIIDKGKGMSIEDIKNKWLFVAFSAKRDLTEDVDYRSKIGAKKYFAGAKGIGRFSCDKLGRKLRIISKKDTPNASFVAIEVDWEDFERNQNDEFADVTVNQYFPVNVPYDIEHGTIIEISDLRSLEYWHEKNILDLKRSLAKLINPFASNDGSNFNITIRADDFLPVDIKEPNIEKKINGPVFNNIMGILDIKTTKINSYISEDAKEIVTELSDGGFWIFRVKERNTYSKVSNILIELYFLNQSAKNSFTRNMGIRPTEYGSVFVYKNGFRVLPYGEPDLDPFGLDIRHSKRLGDYVGNRDLIGRIEIVGDNPDFKETTSRGDGLIKNEAYYQLYDFFLNKVIARLETFRKNITRFGIDFEYIENIKGESDKIFSYLTSEFNNHEIIDIEINDKIFEVLKDIDSESDSVRTVFRRIRQIVHEVGNEELKSYLSEIDKKIQETIEIANTLEKNNRSFEKEIAEKTRENLFLKSVKSDDQLISLMHHIGVFSNNISLDIDYILNKIGKNKIYDEDEFVSLLNQIKLENQKILTVAKISTSANSRINANDQKMDLVAFVCDYIDNISKFSVNNVKIELINASQLSFISLFSPIEMMIVIDNIINNSEKARSKNIKIVFEKLDELNLEIRFIDDGIGIPRENISKIFTFGFTTTTGSGIGLSHVSEILAKINASINVNPDYNKGAEFVLTFKKRIK